MGSGLTGFEEDAVVAVKDAIGMIAHQTLDVIDIAVGILDAGEGSGGEQGTGGIERQGAGKNGDVIEINGNLFGYDVGEFEVKGLDMFLAIAEIVGRHEEDGGDSGRDGFFAEKDRPIEGGVRDVDQNGQTAALDGEIEHAGAVLQHEMDELAGRAEQGDSIDSALV